MRWKQHTRQNMQSVSSNLPRNSKENMKHLAKFKKNQTKQTKQNKRAYLFILLQHYHRRAEIKNTMDTSELLYKDTRFWMSRLKSVSILPPPFFLSYIWLGLCIKRLILNVTLQSYYWSLPDDFRQREGMKNKQKAPPGLCRLAASPQMLLCHDADPQRQEFRSNCASTALSSWESSFCGNVQCAYKTVNGL